MHTNLLFFFTYFYTIVAKHIFFIHCKDKILPILHILQLCIFLTGFFAVT
jgi:hypothetical protein